MFPDGSRYGALRPAGGWVGGVRSSGPAVVSCDAVTRRLMSICVCCVRRGRVRSKGRCEAAPWEGHVHRWGRDVHRGVEGRCHARQRCVNHARASAAPVPCRAAADLVVLWLLPVHREVRVWVRSSVHGTWRVEPCVARQFADVRAHVRVFASGRVRLPRTSSRGRESMSSQTAPRMRVDGGKTSELRRCLAWPPPVAIPFAHPAWLVLNV